MKNKALKEGEKKQKRYGTQKTKSKMADIKSTMSIITLNVNGLNNLIKRQKLLDGMEKQGPTICYRK